MPSVDQDLDIYTNADEMFTIAVTDTSDVPVDLTTFADLCWILSRRGTEILRYELADPELVIADVTGAGANDGIRVNLVPAVTTALSLGRLYIHQAWGTIGGRDRPLCVGYVTVLRGDGC